MAFVIVYGVTCNLNIAIVAMFVAALLVLVLFDIPHCQRFTRVTVGLSAKKGAFFPSHIVACGCRIGRGECHLCHPQAIFSYGFRGMLHWVSMHPSPRLRWLFKWERSICMVPFWISFRVCFSMVTKRFLDLARQNGGGNCRCDCCVRHCVGTRWRMGSLLIIR